MKNNFTKTHQIFLSQLFNDFTSKITGCNLSRIVKRNPENVLYVGKLMSVQDANENKAYTSETFIDSIGVDFYVNENNINTAILELFPQGDFYYRAYPTIEEQRQALLEEINLPLQHDKKYNCFEEIINDYYQNPRLFSDYSIKLVPVYKKICINKSNFSVNIALRDVLDTTKEFGFVDKNHSINAQLNTHIQQLQNEILIDEEAYKKVILEPIKIEHLVNQDTYKRFLNDYAKQDNSLNQNWYLYFDIAIKKIKDRYIVAVTLVNDSRVLYSKQHRSRSDYKYSIETLFNSGIKIQLENASFLPIELDYFADDYKYDKSQYALGNNCSILYDKTSKTLQTTHLPLYKQYRLITKDELAIKFLDLIEKPIEVLTNIFEKMQEECINWETYRSQIYGTLTATGKESIDNEIKEFKCEISRFKDGIDVINNYPQVKRSFIQMNKTFVAVSKKYTTWRLFQIVFIVSIIPDIVACDKNLMPEDEISKTTLSDMALLYFPTGSGKTEAFLGALVFNLFFDRHRGKSVGVTSILRYPLRLLSVQQVQRMANVLAQAELIRRNDSTISDSDTFSLGYFVGDKNTPNSLNIKDYVRYNEMTEEQRDENRIIDICPFCNKKTVHLRADQSVNRLIHYCDNSECKSGGDLPLYIVDSEIYRYLPSAIISTVDKLAIMGFNANFRNILDGAAYKCPIHGYTSKQKCIESSCSIEIQHYIKTDMYDPAPTLLIQDELHLIRESLGTYASHYESFLKYYIKTLSKSKRDVKIIGATATISSYESQIYHLYGRFPIRFPCESPYIDKDFYSYVDYDDLQRIILGYAPYGRAVVDSVVFSLKYMREVVFEYYKDLTKILAIPNIGISDKLQAFELLKNYWIFLEYNNVKRDGNNVEGAIETPINVELIEEGITPFITRKMTGDETFQDIREVLAEVENNENVFDGVNIIAATSMISHGVDADRFNVMFFFGIPGNVAEYIQAYSRTGRKYPSIVVDIIRPTRETDQSYLKNFESIHKYKDLLVEAVPINRWATRAIDNTLPGIFTSLLLIHYDPQLEYSTGPLFYMKNLKKGIQLNLLHKDQIKEQLLFAFSCTEEDGTVQDLGKQYHRKICQFIDDIWLKIVDKNWGNENLSDGFSRIGYHIMNSFRDTDSQLFIELE